MSLKIITLLKNIRCLYPTEKLSREIQNSLETYKKIIPYHGLVLNKGNGFITMTGGKEFNVLPGGEVQIFKKSEKITHPLYKTTLEFKKEKGL